MKKEVGRIIKKIKKSEEVGRMRERGQESSNCSKMQ
jgi:hypothetical protein